MEMSNVSAKGFAVLTVLYNGIQDDGKRKKDLKIPEIINVVKKKYNIEDITQSYVYSLFVKLEAEEIVFKKNCNNGYDVRYILTSNGTQFYKRLNKLFLSLSKTNLDTLIEIIKERPSEEQETIILEVADRLTKYSNVKYSINKEKKN